MAEKYSMVRVKESTLERLQLTAEGIVRAVELGIRADPGVLAETINPRASGFSLDKLLNLLLDMRDAHHRRARKAREASRARRRVKAEESGE